jgi:hypothetical protein
MTRPNTDSGTTACKPGGKPALDISIAAVSLGSIVIQYYYVVLLARNNDSVADSSFARYADTPVSYLTICVAVSPLDVCPQVRDVSVDPVCDCFELTCH